MVAVSILMPRTKKKRAVRKKSVRASKAEEEKSRSVRRRKACPDCNSRNITFDTETEQLICQDCGLIFEELVEVEAGEEELRLF